MEQEKKRFEIEKLEERIAPAAAQANLTALLSIGNAHNGNVNDVCVNEHALAADKSGAVTVALDHKGEC